jgi:hypothetical protein
LIERKEGRELLRNMRGFFAQSLFAFVMLSEGMTMLLDAAAVGRRHTVQPVLVDEVKRSLQNPQHLLKLEA